MTDADSPALPPARAENVIVVRQAVAGLGEALGLTDQRVDDLKTVVSEACNNVVLHAYEGEPGPLDVSADPGDGRARASTSPTRRRLQARGELRARPRSASACR